MITSKKDKIISAIVFSIYMILLIWLVLFKFSTNLENLPDIRNINLIPFRGSMIVNGRIQYSEIIYNMLVFIPLGVYIYIFNNKWSFFKMIIPSLGLSILLEALQYLFAIGATDITDIIANTLGGSVGILVYRLFSIIFKKSYLRIINIIGIVIEVFALILITLLTIANK